MVSPQECLFCRIIGGEIPAKKVFEDAATLAFLDINPRNPGHTLVIPKRHCENIFDLPDAEIPRYFAAVKKIAILVKNGTKAQGMSICQNNGAAAGQVVSHLHFHLIPRFLNEGPPALEAIMPVRKMDDKSLDKIAQTIKSGSTIPVMEDVTPKQERTPLVSRPVAPPVADKPIEVKKKPVEEEEDDTDEFEEIDFNL